MSATYVCGDYRVDAGMYNCSKCLAMGHDYCPNGGGNGWPKDKVDLECCGGVPVTKCSSIPRAAPLLLLLILLPLLPVTQ